MKILAISGSLRAASANTRVIEALAHLAGPGVVVSIYRGLSDLPLFNPDLEDRLPAEVADLRRKCLLMKFEPEDAYRAEHSPRQERDLASDKDRKGVQFETFAEHRPNHFATRINPLTDVLHLNA